jgi:hypothetical protein
VEKLVRGELRIGMGSSQNRYELMPANYAPLAFHVGAVVSAIAWAAGIVAAFLLWRRKRD